MPTPALKLSAAAQPLLTAVKGADATAQALVNEALAHAASVDGDRVLDGPEAQAVKDAFDALSPAGAALDVTGAQQLKDVAAVSAQGRIVSMLEGGYALSALGRSVAAHIKVLADL